VEPRNVNAGWRGKDGAVRPWVHVKKPRVLPIARRRVDAPSVVV
jgi:hypothetical protein